MAHEHVRARRGAAVTLVCLGAFGLAVSLLKALTWDGAEPVTTGACVVERIVVGYDIGYVPELGGYGVTTAALSDVPDGCAGREVAVTLHGADDQPLAEARTPVTAPTTTVDMGGTVAVTDLGGVSLALVTDEPVRPR
ncbi:hypothetical protein [Cellulomonas triticagri]|uniref:Uncharacterized protein n=1 Tax=Cellulomonas triticagri TaxID=2483352 RepID=A0A3M2J7E0_9CELL|nr:hypothetical protein [Cellulomonas triticagri]RMI08784.1 hypothetical protein EBM89_12965 [Cellulomonas triticagri]